MLCQNFSRAMLVLVIFNAALMVTGDTFKQEDNFDRVARENRAGVVFKPILGKRTYSENRDAVLRMLEAADVLQYYYDRLPYYEAQAEDPETKVTKKVIFTPKLGRSSEEKRAYDVDFTPRLGRRQPEPVTASDDQVYRQDNNEIDGRSKFFSPRLGRTAKLTPRLGRSFNYGCLLIVTAEGYVLFAANLEDFKNLAKRFVPENLAGKLTKMVSESSVQYRKEKEDIGDNFSDDDRTPQRGKNMGRYGIKRPERYGVDRKTQNNNDFSSTRFKIKKHEQSSDERFDTTPSKFYGIKPVDDDRGKEEKETDREVEEELNRIQFSTMKASKDRRYKTVQRTTPTKQWFQQSSVYLPSKDNHLPSFSITTPKNIFDIDIRKEALQTSTGNEIEITDSDSEKTYKDNLRDVTTFTKDVSREVDEKYTRPTKNKTPVQEEMAYENPKVKTEKQLRINGRDVQQSKLNKQIKSNDGMMFDKVLLNKNKGSYEELPEKDEVYFSEEAVKSTSKNTNQPKLIKNIAREHINKDDVFESEETTPRMNYNKKPEYKEPNKHDNFEGEETTPLMDYNKKPDILRKPNKHDVFESEETTPRMNYNKKPEIKESIKHDVFESQGTTLRMNYNKLPETKEPHKHDIFESEETTPRMDYSKKSAAEILRKPSKNDVFESEETTPRMNYNKKPEIKEPNKHDNFESEETTSRMDYNKKPEILRKPNKHDVFESEETTPRMDYNKKPENEEPNKHEMSESEETTSRMNYNKKPEIKESNKHDAFESQETTLRMNYNKLPETKEPHKHDIFESEETTSIFNYNKKPGITKEPTTTEKDLEKEVQSKPEPVKARTENLQFNSKEENATVNPNIMKGTGIPTRERYKMSSPDYYKKLPRIVEKYDFKEPIPEKDREHEKIDDRFAQDPARINKNVHRQNVQRKVSRQFKAILDELGMALNKSKHH